MEEEKEYKSLSSAISELEKSASDEHLLDLRQSVETEIEKCHAALEERKAALLSEIEKHQKAQQEQKDQLAATINSYTQTLQAGSTFYQNGNIAVAKQMWQVGVDASQEIKKHSVTFPIPLVEFIKTHGSVGEISNKRKHQEEEEILEIPDDDDNAVEEVEAVEAVEEENEGEEGDEGFFEVEEVMGMRVIEGGRVQYLLRWLGYGPEHDSWTDAHYCSVTLIEGYERARREREANVAKALPANFKKSRKF